MGSISSSLPHLRPTNVSTYLTLFNGSPCHLNSNISYSFPSLTSLILILNNKNTSQPKTAIHLSSTDTKTDLFFENLQKSTGPISLLLGLHTALSTFSSISPIPDWLGWVQNHYSVRRLTISSTSVPKALSLCLSETHKCSHFIF